MRILGIDEAGRGCVLGDLFIGGFIVESHLEPELGLAGATDSKKLSPKKRVVIRERLKDIGQADVRRITPEEIDGGNLNTLEEAVIVDLVRTHQPDRIIIDALGHPSTLPAVVARLQSAANTDAHVEWLMEPKADLNHFVVGAASIFAKTARDEALQELKEEWGPLGSGYPSDPVTREWLTTQFRTGKPWPHFVRTRWGTIQAITQLALFKDS